MAETATALPGYDVVRASGPDAAAFLQAQLANDVRALAERAWQWNCYLTPQGRVQSVFVLFRDAADAFLLAVPGGLAEAVRERLARYRLRSKVELALDRSWQACGVLDAGVSTAAPAVALAADLPGARRLLLEPAPAAEVDAEALARWRCADIATGVPVLTAPVTDGHTPQALSLDRLAAYSVKKGCYPGQEIVARTHFLGRSKRSLARFACPAGAAPEPGSELLARDSAEPVGTVISAAAKASGGFELLAVVREGHAAARLREAPDAPLETLPFAS